MVESECAGLLRQIVTECKAIVRFDKAMDIVRDDMVENTVKRELVDYSTGALSLEQTSSAVDLATQSQLE